MNLDYIHTIHFLLYIAIEVKRKVKKTHTLCKEKYGLVKMFLSIIAQPVPIRLKSAYYCV